MASAGSATAGLRHSFMAPGATDADVRAKKMARTPSLPVHKTALDKPSTSKHKKRPSGLFESSESGSDSASPTERRGKLSTATAATRHHSLGASPVTTMSMPSRENLTNNERKGLFEFDDDGADSVETLRERVKLRQKKKEHEVSSLRNELHAALARVSELGDELARERKEKDEFAIRMDECQRIIEKRNKQLIKASEKLARVTEQSESHVNELQQQLKDLSMELETTRAHDRVALDQQRAEYEEKLRHQRARLESQLEAVTLAASEKLRMKEADEENLHQRIAKLEAEVVGATSRIAESSEYQILLKRCDDAEAISRGLHFQLEKAQNEKKYLKKQLMAASSPPAPSPAFMPSTDLFDDLSSTHMGRDHSPTSSVASADLSSFDFSRTEVSPTTSLLSNSPPQPPSAPTSSSTSRKPSLSVSTAPDIQRRAQVDDSSRVETSSKDSLESVYGGGDDEVAPSMPPLATSQSESKARPGSGTINFFEKISIKFKRSASSPRGTTPPAFAAKTEELDQKATQQTGSVATSTQAPLPTSGSSPIDIPPANRRKVLPKRPKMYVAKSPSDYEESSDSIFGSDSESEESSDDEEDDQPPPPPPKDFARSPTGSADPPSSSIPPPPPPPLFGGASDEGGSSSDESEPPRRHDDLRRVILPTPASPPPIATQPDYAKSEEVQSLSSSDSEHSDSSNDERKVKAQEADRDSFVRVDTEDTKARAKSAPAFSDSEEETSRRKEKRRQRVETDDTSTRQSANKASAEPRKEKRERSRSTEADTGSSAAAKVNRMNEYMEARARKRQEKLSKKEEKENAEHRKREEYEKEWERMAEEERERRRKQQKARRTGKRRPASMKTVRVSQMRQQINKHQKDMQGEGGNTKGEDSDDENGPPQPDAQGPSYQSSGSDSSDNDDAQQAPQRRTSDPSSPPLPPEPTAVNTDLYLRQQARLREHHEMEMKKKQESAEADQVRGQIHRRVEMWAFAKELHHMILTLDQISSNEALRQCQLMVVQSPDPETLRKAYRNIIRVIHPDKLRNATITEQLEAKELFTVLNQAFEKFKAQQ